jgi:hypothetical protein
VIANAVDVRPLARNRPLAAEGRNPERQDSRLEQLRFERSVRAAGNAFEIVLFSYSGVSVPARNNISTERDQRFESGFPQQ